MARKKSIITIKVPANNGFYGLPLDYLNPNISNEKEPKSQKALGKLFSSNSPSFVVKNAGDFCKKLYRNINIISFRKNNDFSSPKIVYEVKKENGQYYLATGLYVGVLTVGDIRIEINTGYNDCLLKRMLNVANNIFFDLSSQENVNGNFDDNILSVILEYLFLSSFRSAFAMGIPSKYIKTHETGFNIKGNIDTKKYLVRDIAYGSQISFSYNQQVFSQDIIDVLYLALKSIDSSDKGHSMIVGDCAKYFRQLKQMYSGIRPSRSTIHKIEKDRSLNNPMYFKYRRVLKYAKYILEYKNLIYEDNIEKGSASGFLLDISELWEIYLANLLSNYFVNYTVNSQVELNLYKNTFYQRSYYPDIIMESDDSVVIIDAKFKKMNFINSDIDRDDLHQIHSYVGFYVTQAQKKVKLCSLVYPTAKDDNIDKTTIDDNLYGIHHASTRFSIGYIKVGKTYQEMIENERAFLNRLASSI